MNQCAICKVHTIVATMTLKGWVCYHCNQRSQSLPTKWTDAPKHLFGSFIPVVKPNFDRKKKKPKEKEMKLGRYDIIIEEIGDGTL